MHPTIAARVSEVAALCQRFGVARLDLFGSASRSDFDPAPSDVDLIVDFLPEARDRAFDNYFGLHEELERLLGRPVDLVTENSVRNPYLRRAIEASRQKLYGP